MDVADTRPSLSVSEEVACAITHGIGAIASVGAGAVLITLAALWGGALHVVSASIFVASLVLLYTASTLYHAIPGHVFTEAKLRLRVFDHCAIYVLIAGTYTPFLLVSLNGTWGWTLFIAIWVLAAIGIVLKLFFTGRFDRLSTLGYILMGWLIVVAGRPMLEALSGFTIAWIVAGGLAYTLGTVFYLWRGLPWAHAVWHLFVLAGSVCHFVAVMAAIIG